MPQEQSKRRVLVVEDEPKIRATMLEHLRLAGFEVTAAVDGDEALSAVRTQPFDLVILDLSLPKRSGLEVCQSLRKQPQSARVPIILYTGKEQEDVIASLGTDQRQLQEWQADAYVHKTDGMAALLQQIHRVLWQGGAKPQEPRHG